MRIYIIGMPGTGKTYSGRMLSKSLKLKFYDLDEWVEKKAGMIARQIIQEKGETYFRELEREGLIEISRYDNTVVSCGGGTPVYYDNMELMKKTGIVVWLNTDLDIIARRIAQNITRRPLFIGLNGDEIDKKLRDIYEKRKKIYAKADIITDINSQYANSLNTVIQKVMKVSQRRIK